MVVPLELLLPAAERSPRFTVGSRQFDPVRVGYKTDPFDGGFVFDTALPALPLLSLAFLGANADLLLERTRGRRGSPERESGAGP